MHKYREGVKGTYSEGYSQFFYIPSGGRRFFSIHSSVSKAFPVSSWDWSMELVEGQVGVKNSS